jgi:hypothetical protein
MLDSLARTDARSFWKAAQEMFAKCDPFMLFRGLSIAFRLKTRTSDTEGWDSLLNAIPVQDRWLLSYFLPCLEEDERATKIQSLRSRIHDPTHRFFLALLLNVPTRKDLYRLISERFSSQDPERLVLAWLAEIFREKRAGIKLNSEMLFVLAQIMQNDDFERAKPMLQEAFRCHGQADEAMIKDAWLQLHSLDIFRPLFGEFSTMGLKLATSS